jgi:hypothetical protein
MRGTEQPTEREKKCRARYREMLTDPTLLPSSDPADVIRFHLYHLARYLSRLEGFMDMTGSPLVAYRDHDLGACLLGATYVMDDCMSNTDDALFGYLWDHFSHGVNRFGNGDPTLTHEGLHSAFQELCEYIQYDPWEKP